MDRRIKLSAASAPTTRTSGRDGVPVLERPPRLRITLHDDGVVVVRALIDAARSILQPPAHLAPRERLVEEFGDFIVSFVMQRAKLVPQSFTLSVDQERE